MTALIVTGVALLLMYFLCLKPMRASAHRRSCCDITLDRDLEDLQQQVASRRAEIEGERPA